MNSSKSHFISKQKREPQSIAWAWAAGWLLVSMGQAISDVYSSPNRGLTAYYLLGFAGWIIGAAGTLRYMRRKFGADANVTALSAAGWTVGAVVAVVLGLFFLHTWNAGFLGPLAAAALGAAIGGALTLPMASLSSPGTVALAILRGMFSWGAAFLIFQILAFYAWYMLYMLTVNTLSQIFGNLWASIFVGVIPASVGGLLAGWLAARLAGLRRVRPIG